MFLPSLSELAFGSRLKALSDQFYGAVDEVYRACGAPIESRWFPVLRFLWERGPASVSDVAAAIGQTHSAVSQLADRLERAGLLQRRRDAADGRRSVLVLTDQAHQALGGLGVLWCAVRRGVKQALGEHADALLAVLTASEDALRGRPMAQAILAEHAELARTPVRVVPYEPRWREHFGRLNVQWLERHFVVEPIDRVLMEDPERTVLASGGAIFFALLGEEVIGTCALLHESPGIYELSKMGVDESFRGLGAGRRLLEAAIAEFHRRGGRSLFLESSSKLGTALGMYARAGFVLQPGPRPGSHYARADVYMVYQPTAEDGGGRG